MVDGSHFPPSLFVEMAAANCTVIRAIDEGLISMQPQPLEAPPNCSILCVSQVSFGPVSDGALDDET